MFDMDNYTKRRILATEKLRKAYIKCGTGSLDNLDGKNLAEEFKVLEGMLEEQFYQPRQHLFFHGEKQEEKKADPAEDSGGGVMWNREVTERDFRMPEFRDADPKDYEFRADGKVVRKDRWETGIHRIRAALGDDRREFEIDDIVLAVRALVATLPDAPEEEED